uniref:BHLH domain-containing protein n=1 Tax=Oryza nivara TaxID=4536 RepID=A0A0E0FHL4_ORYNI
MSERKRREKLNGSFVALQSRPYVLPPGSKLERQDVVDTDQSKGVREVSRVKAVGAGGEEPGAGGAAS